MKITKFVIKNTQYSDDTGKVWIVCSTKNSNKNGFSMLGLGLLSIDNAQLFEVSTYNNVAVQFRNSVIEIKLQNHF
jgi:hypothetical protein